MGIIDLNVLKKTHPIKLLGHIILLLSLASLLLYLYRIDMLSFPDEKLKIHFIFISLIPLIMGFGLAAFNWQYLLAVNGYPISFSQSLYTVGMSVFAKYIPGKIWATMGRASLTVPFNVPLHQALLISFHLQILFMSSGMILGLVGLAFSGKVDGGRFLLYFGLIILAVYLLLPGFMWILRKCKPDLSSTILKSSYPTTVLLRGVVLFLLQWLCWSVGFYLLSRSILENEISMIATGLAFPLSVCIGILSVISPGGLGVREGMLIGTLVFIGIPLSQATAISVLARLWFVLGELWLFLSALIVKKIYLGKHKLSRGV